MPAAVTSLRSSYRRLEDDRRRVTGRSANTVTVSTTADTAAAATIAAATRDPGNDDARCPRAAPRDTSRVMLKTQVTAFCPGNSRAQCLNLLYEDRSINELQNGVIFLIFKCVKSDIYIL